MEFQIAFQVTGPVNVPLNKTPFGIPLVPLPLITNDPPAAKMPPSSKLPLMREPVVKLTDPRLPDAFIPFMLTVERFEPDRVKEVPLLVICPPLSLKLLLLAKAKRGKVNTQLNIRATRLDILNSETVAYPGAWGAPTLTEEEAVGYTEVPVLWR